MKKRTIFAVVFVLIISLLTACSDQQSESSAEMTPEAEQAMDESVIWSFEETEKTLYVYENMGAFEPDAPDFDGTTSNAPWAEFLPNIETIVVGDNVSSIGDYTFAFCSSLKNVEVGKNVDTLDFRCFFKCGDFDNDSSIDMHFNSMPSFGEDVFGYTWDNPNVVIYVPDDMKAYWADFIAQKGEMRLDGWHMQMPNNTVDIVNVMLSNAQQLYLGDIGNISKNDGGHMGTVYAENRCNEDRMEIFAGDDGATNIPFETRLRDFGSENRPQQAMLVKFQPERADYLRFDFIGMGDYSVTFEEGEWWFVDVGSVSKKAFSECAPNDLILDGFIIYNVLFATDEDMNVRVLIWDDRNPNDYAYFEDNLYQGMDNIYESNWKMNIAFSYADPFGQLNIYEYAVYTFDELTNDLGFLSSSSKQNDEMQNNGNDFGPYWTINIGGNFDILSDMVWQSVESIVIDENGNQYVGYNLADLMSLAGYDSDFARVVFSDANGSEQEVNPTNEAYIVFKKNDSFMGGSYLLYNQIEYDYPVIEVKMH